MKGLRQILKKNIKKHFLFERNGFPKDSEIMSCPSIYKMVRKSERDSFIGTGFNKTLAHEANKGGGGRGAAAGEGIYSSIKLGGRTGACRLAGDWYGTTVIQGKVLGGFERFLMWDGENFPEIAHMIVRYYGKKSDGTLYTPYEQCMMITNNNTEISNLIRNYGINANNPSKYWGAGEEAIKKLRRAGIRGFLYNFQGGPTALPFDWGSIIPVAYADNVYNGEPEDNIKSRLVPCYPNYTSTRGERIFTKEVYENMCDWTFQLDGFYDSYDKESIKEFNGESYCSVYLRTKGWNIVQIDRTNYSNPKAKEILPIWLPEKPNKVSNDGTFDFKYGGIWWQGALSLPNYGGTCFWFPEDIDKFYDIADINSDDDWVPLSIDGLQYAGNNLKYQKKINENKLKAIFRKHLLNESFDFSNEKDFFNKRQRIVYVCAHDWSIDGLCENGFSRQFTRENDKAAFYGDGVYGCFELGNGDRNTGAIYLSNHRGNKPDGYKYGPIILKCVLLHGFSRFLLFDEDLAKRYYGRNYNITDQVAAILSKDYPKESQSLINDINNIVAHPRNNWDAGNFFDCKKNSSGGNTSRTTGLLHEFFDDGAWGTNAGGGRNFQKFTNLFRKVNIRGAAYHGGNDGPAFVCWHYDEVIPIEVSYDHGKTFVKVTKTGMPVFNFNNVKERLLRDNDPVQKFGHIYPYVSDKPVLCNIANKQFPVTIVKTHNGGYNIILTNTKGKTLSPYDFDTQPIIGSDGIFYFVYKRKQFSGIINLPSDNIPAIWFPEDLSRINDEPDINSDQDWVTFDYLPSIINQL